MHLFCFCVCLCHIVFCSCRLVVTYWERDDLLAVLYLMFSCALVTFPYAARGQVFCLIVWTPDLCLFPSFIEMFCSAQTEAC